MLASDQLPPRRDERVTYGQQKLRPFRTASVGADELVAWVRSDGDMLLHSGEHDHAVLGAVALFHEGPAGWARTASALELALSYFRPRRRQVSNCCCAIGAAQAPGQGSRG